MLARLHRLVAQGLAATEALWPPIQAAYAWFHKAAHVLANHEQQEGAEVQRTYQALLAQMQEA